MATSLRSSVDTVLADANRAFGTFVGLLWIGLLAGLLVGRAAATASYRFPVPVELGWAVLFVAAALGTMWLEGGGYERFDADPDGGPRFAWLAVVFVPLSFLPTRLALGYLLAFPAIDHLFVLATTLLSGWLAFYGGLERFALEFDDFARVIAYAAALAVVPVGAVALFDVSWLTADPVAAAIAVGVQIGACWFGFARDDRDVVSAVRSDA